MMQFGLVFSTFGPNSAPAMLAELAAEAERAGWDGVFLPDAIQMLGLEAMETSDAWVSLAAMAVATERVRLGPIVTAPARYRPWQLARMTTSLDRLSQGRLVLGVGIGDAHDRAFTSFGELEQAKERAELTDEALAILDGLWGGEPFAFSGRHFSVAETSFQPTPVQRPRIPVWVGWQWPNRRPLQRVARWDGAVPFAMSDEGEYTHVPPEAIAALADDLRARRDAAAPLELVAYAPLLRRSADAEETVRAMGAAGATWLIEFVGPEWSRDELRAAVTAGPPVLAAYR